MRVVLGLCAVSLGLGAQEASSQRTTDVVERLLDQIGGRETWAAATGFHMVEVLHDESLPLPAVREYWVDFARPRIMERTTTNSTLQLQALNESGGWMIRDGEHSPWSVDEVSGWRGFWPGIPTRVFHLLATNDSSLEVELREGNRLDVRLDGRFAVWIALDDDAVPVAYGREESHTYTHFLGRMEQYGPVRLWSAAYEPGDLWQVTMVDFDLFDDTLPVSFDPPTDRESHRPAPAGGGT
jgi:hypothetical protein